MAKRADTESPRLPKVTTVKLSKEMFADVWWIARVEKKAPAIVLSEVAGTLMAARRKRHDATIAKLSKLDAEEDQIVESAQDRSAE